MNDNERIDLTKPVSAGGTQQTSWRDPSTGEIYTSGVQAQPQAQPQFQQQAQPQVQQQFQQPVYGDWNNVGYVQQSAPIQQNGATKFCKFCGQRIVMDAVLCTYCGRQVEEFRTAPAYQQPIIINNSNNNVNTNVVGGGRAKNKWVAVLLCLFLGEFGIHRFYEGKIGTGLLWFFTFGLGLIGWFIDLIILLTKPNPYYV